MTRIASFLLGLLLAVSCVACTTIDVPIPAPSMEVRCMTYEGQGSMGTGFLVAKTATDSYVLTAGHVTGDPPKFRATWYVEGWKAEVVASKIQGIDPDYYDVALLVVHTVLPGVPREIDGTEAFQDWDLQVQTQMYAKHARPGPLPGQILCDPPVQPGDSGSPVLHRGQVVGLVYARAADGSPPAYYVPGRLLLTFLEGRIK